MRADERCKTCNKFGTKQCIYRGQQEGEEYEWPVDDSWCEHWSANLDGAACEKCVYWSGKVAGSEFGICHKNAVVLRDYMQTCGDYWCGEFVPAVQP
jgi:hypothetical protein